MAHEHAIAAADSIPAAPRVRSIGLADLKDALAKGYEDFSALPSHAVFLCLIYPIIGLLLAGVTFGYQLLWLVFPLIAGFALLGPLAALGVYELSRRREQGLDVSLAHAADVVRSHSIGAIVGLGLMLLTIFLAWLVVAQAIYYAIFGSLVPSSLSEFVSQVLTTPAGWTLIIVGNLVGFLFALAAFCISVVSFPMLLDRDVSATTAVETSLRAVLASPKTMALWGLIVAAALVIGSLPFLLGLAVVIPILGHATWHLYRKVVERNASLPDRPPRPPGPQRYAADFPAALFQWRGKRD